MLGLIVETYWEKDVNQIEMHVAQFLDHIKILENCRVCLGVFTLRIIVFDQKIFGVNHPSVIIKKNEEFFLKCFSNSSVYF